MLKRYDLAKTKIIANLSLDAENDPVFKALSSLQFPINVATASLPSQSDFIFEFSSPSIT